MATVVDEKIKAAIAEHGWLKVALSVVFSALTFGKARGWFAKGTGPKS